MNEKERSEKHFAELAEHRSRGDANESNAEGAIYPAGEPVERTRTLRPRARYRGRSRAAGGQTRELISYLQSAA